MRLWKRSFLNFSYPFHDGDRCHIKTSPLICSSNQWTGFFMIMASVVKELKWGKNEEKCYVQHILWSSKISFCFWIKAYIFFSNGHIHNVVSTLPKVVKIDVENGKVVSTLSNVAQFNVEKHNAVSTFIWRCATSRRHINLKTTLNWHWNVCWDVAIHVIINYVKKKPQLIIKLTKLKNIQLGNF